MSEQRQDRRTPKPSQGGAGLRQRTTHHYRPVRTPLTSMGPSLDEERRRHRTARLVAITSVVAVAAIVLLVWIVGLLGREVVADDRSASAAASGGTAAAAPIVQTGPPNPQTLAQTVVDKGSASLRLQLPIRREAVTGIGFGPRHQGGVIELQPSGTLANTSWLRKATQRFLSTTPASDLRWYRLAEGPPSMVVVGALPGTEVYAPIDGKVLSIKEYELDGEPRGQLVELQPVGDGSTVLVLRNLDADPDLEVGESVSHSVTRIGVVRDMGDAVEAPLSDYTHDTGSGVDMYVLRIDVPSSALG